MKLSEKRICLETDLKLLLPKWQKLEYVCSLRGPDYSTTTTTTIWLRQNIGQMAGRSFFRAFFLPFHADPIFCCIFSSVISLLKQNVVSYKGQFPCRNNLARCPAWNRLSWPGLKHCTTVRFHLGCWNMWVPWLGTSIKKRSSREKAI